MRSDTEPARQHLAPRWQRPRPRLVDLAFLLAATGFCAVRFLRLHARIAPIAAPTLAFLRDPQATPTPAMGWWAWWDQGRYQKAAVAWANGVTDPRLHWYLPGYPLLGAPFTHLTPSDPFMLPDLACLLGTLWLSCGLAAFLLDDLKWRVPAACGLFVASTILPPKVIWSWVVPWTTTPETLCLYGALFAALRLLSRATRRDAFFAGLAAVATAGFRPVDAGVLIVLILLVSVPVLISRRPRHAGPRIGLIIAAGCGALLPLLIFGGAYLAVWGPHPSAYLILSRQIGFEPRLLALRWVTLMVDPRPLYPGGQGLSQVFFWIIPGIAGMAATLVAVSGARRVPHLLVIGTLIPDVILFLVYRDLHPTGLWRFAGYHYFKWTLPLFALYALRLVMIVSRRHARRPLAVACGCLTIPLLFCWRADLARLHPAATGSTDLALTVPGGLSPIDMIALLPGHGSGTIPVVGATATTASGASFRSGLDFVVYDANGTLRVAPLRRLPALPTTVRFDKGTVVRIGVRPWLARQVCRFGLPFWLAGRWHPGFWGL